MPDPLLSNSQIVSAYREKTPGSERLAGEAREVLPSGITHDSRYLKPYALYIDRAAGSHKWDVDGNRYVDYFGGHGALLLGHGHPDVMAATSEAMAAGTHFGANHPREVTWAQQVIKMVPSAERIRFTSSGTEATLMALRLARAHTGKNKFVRFKTHFHGWHDHMAGGYANHFDGTATTGVIPAVASNVVLVSPQDISEVRQVLENDNDIAAVICEPTGASFGMVPMSADFTAQLREMTAKQGVLLIFDEVVTGFRCSPGGAQQAYGVTPDLTTLAKILSGGLPGGGVAGRQEILDHLDFERSEALSREKIQHPGTFNANPVSAAAGLAALKIIETTDACERANASAAWLRGRFNEILEAEDVPWAAYGAFSGLHLFTNAKGIDVKPSSFRAEDVDYETLKAKRSDLVMKLRLATAVNGVDLSSAPGGLTSAMHTQEDLDLTAEAFREAIRMLKRDGEF
ncbi:MAG: aminotransferase class III-fold pyridoxal phosphate-dependent enzyme [Proteobacteria bacterium]|nr:aminotransferase class III-fold pyridoxal phosphate-dependent enzyme [Pseudomonadota bacterium]